MWVKNGRKGTARQVKGEDNDMRKGAKEEDRPGPERSSHPGLDPNGLPNDPIAIAADVLGANEDQSQG